MGRRGSRRDDTADRGSRAHTDQAYADGCSGACVTSTRVADNTHTAKATIARQSGGRRLFSAFDTVEPAPPAAPQVLGAVRASGVVTVSWLEPDNGGSPITGYRVYRSTTSGAETFLTSVPATATKYFDNAAPSTSNWFYRVTAVNAIAEGPFCREVNVNGTAAAATATWRASSPRAPARSIRPGSR